MGRKPAGPKRSGEFIDIQVTAEHPAVGSTGDATLPREQIVEDDLESTKMRDALQESSPASLLPHGARASLRVLQGPAKGRVFALEQPHNTIGRGPENSIVINDEFVSGSHAALYYSQSMEWRILDLDSRNGTLLNGSKVTEFAVRNGDKILIGDHLMLFVVEPD